MDSPSRLRSQKTIICIERGDGVSGGGIGDEVGAGFSSRARLFGDGSDLKVR